MVKRVAIGVGIAVIVLLLIFCITRFIGYRSYQRRKQLRQTKTPQKKKLQKINKKQTFVEINSMVSAFFFCFL